MFYDNTMFLSQTTSTTNLGVEFMITASFDKNMRKALYIIAAYKAPKMKIIHFNSILETILKDMPKDYPTSLSGDCNIDMFKKCQSTTFQSLMYKYKLKLTFFESTTINNTH
jgi:hypothetical protein